MLKRAVAGLFSGFNFSQSDRSNAGEKISKKNFAGFWLSFFVLVTICVVGIWFRASNFDDLLIIKSDQARDALILNHSLENGFQSLPLLGPQVGGTSFRLGPATYYFQFLSGKLFGARAESFAYPDLFFGALVVPLLSFVFRYFFSLPISLWLSALSSVSLLLVTFSRFAWNPNSLPFFTALFTLLFLNTLNQFGWKRWLSLAGAAICFAIIAQLHLAAIFGLGIGLVLFLIFYRPLGWKEIVLFVVIVTALHFPMIMSEWQANGSNTQAFIKAVIKKENKEAKHEFYEKIFRAYQESAGVTYLIISGQQNTDIVLTNGFSIKCDDKCRSLFPYSLLAMVLFGYVVVASYVYLKSVEDANKKRATAFILFWMGGFLFASVLWAYQLETRFYLGIVVPILILFGFAIHQIVSISKSMWAKGTLGVIGIALLFLNLQATRTYLQELLVSQVSAEESGEDLRFGTAPKVTLGQLRAIANEANRQFTNNAPVVITGESLYAKSMFYVLSTEYSRDGCYIRGDKSVPSSFNNLVIEYHPNKKAEMAFGTLAASFKVADTSLQQSNIALPPRCLTY